jgi:type I restriction-modification system DNA methylase subunit
MPGTVTRSAFETLARSFENNPVFGHMHSYDLYRAWLEAVWAFLDAFHNREGFQKTLDRYTFDQGAEFGRMLEIYTQAVEADPLRDILGELFMRLDVNSVKAGQFFTPMSIAEMMARMQFDKAVFDQQVQEKGYVSVCDPAVGSGVMLLAFAKVVHAELGRPALSKVRFFGNDIDQRCVLMCRIQLRMNGLDAVGRMAGRLGALDTSSTAQDMTLNPGRQLTFPGIAA